MLESYFPYSNYPNHMQVSIGISKELTEQFSLLIGNPTNILKVSDNESDRLGSIWCGSRLLVACYISYKGVYKGSLIKVRIEDKKFSQYNPSNGF